MKTKTDLKKLLEKTGRKLYITDDILKTAPSKIDGTLEYFTIGKYVSDDNLQAEYDKRGLIPASIENMLADEDINKEHQWVGTHWKDNDGKWCFAAFRRWRDGERRVDVHRNDGGWGGRWWFSGVRKSALSTSDTQPSLTLNLEQAIAICKENGLKIIRTITTEEVL